MTVSSTTSITSPAWLAPRYIRSHPICFPLLVWKVTHFALLAFWSTLYYVLLWPTNSKPTYKSIPSTAQLLDRDSGSIQHGMVCYSSSMSIDYTSTRTRIYYTIIVLNTPQYNTDASLPKEPSNHQLVREALPFSHINIYNY